MNLTVNFAVLLAAALLSTSSYAETNLEACRNYNTAGDYRRAVEKGKAAVIEIPNNGAAHYCLGEAYQVTGNLNGAFAEMKMAEALTANKVDLANTYGHLASIAAMMGKNNIAFEYSNRMLSIARQVGDNNLLATALNNVAIAHNRRGNLDKALEAYEESLSISEQGGEAYNNLSYIYSQKGISYKAIEYLHKAKEVAENNGDLIKLGIYTLNLAYAYMDNSDQMSCKKNLDDGLRLTKKTGDRYWEAAAYKYYGSYFYKMGNKKAAESYFNKSYELFNRIGSNVEAKRVLDKKKDI